ncbi:MAG: GNAT family N-acetyltransferase [Planctomycetota bacterium]
MTQPIQVNTLTAEQTVQLHGLYQKEWWSNQRTLEQAQLVVANSSLLIGLIEPETQRLVGFCRLLTDFVFRGTILDVIVAEDWRDRGLGRQLLDAILTHPRLQPVQTLWLCCLPDMVEFYRKWGFDIMGQEIVWMQRYNTEKP